MPEQTVTAELAGLCRSDFTQLNNCPRFARIMEVDNSQQTLVEEIVFLLGAIVHPRHHVCFREDSTC